MTRILLALMVVGGAAWGQDDLVISTPSGYTTSTLKLIPEYYFSNLEAGATYHFKWSPQIDNYPNPVLGPEVTCEWIPMEMQWGKCKSIPCHGFKGFGICTTTKCEHERYWEQGLCSDGVVRWREVNEN